MYNKVYITYTKVKISCNTVGTYKNIIYDNYNIANVLKKCLTTAESTGNTSEEFTVTAYLFSGLLSYLFSL